MYLAWGASGRRFKSGRPDHPSNISQITSFSKRFSIPLISSISLWEHISKTKP